MCFDCICKFAVLTVLYSRKQMAGYWLIQCQHHCPMHVPVLCLVHLIMEQCNILVHQVSVQLCMAAVNLMLKVSDRCVRLSLVYLMRWSSHVRLSLLMISLENLSRLQASDLLQAGCHSHCSANSVEAVTAFLEEWYKIYTLVTTWQLRWLFTVCGLMLKIL